MIGIATAALSLFIAVTSFETNRTLNVTWASIENRIKTSKMADLSAPVVAEFGAQNAGEFAATLEQRLPPVEVPRRPVAEAAYRGQLRTGKKKNGT